MRRSLRDEEFSAFVRARRVELLRSACLLAAGDTHLAEDLVQTALARLYLAWPRVRRSGPRLAALPAGMRAAVVLWHWLDLSAEETASLLNCSTGTVKSQTAKGTARLRHLLASADPTEMRSHL